MKYRLLGPLEIETGPDRVIIGGHQQRALLATLLLAPGRVVASFDLIAELWPQRPEPPKNNSLHAQVARLRTALPGVPIARRPGGYIIELDPNEIDVTHFHQLRSTADSLARHDPQQAIPIYRQALELWRGNALQDSAIGERCQAAAASLSEARLRSVEQLAKLRIEHDDDPGKIVNDLLEWARLNPLRETLLARLMAALHRGGRGAEAIQIYMNARKRFNEELGIEPGDVMRQEYLRILRHT